MNDRTTAAGRIALALIIVALVHPAHGQGHPPDLKVTGAAGSLFPDGPFATVQIGADGQGIYSAYSSSALTAIDESEGFTLSDGQLDQLWQVIENADFFLIEPERHAEFFADGSFAWLTVQANGMRHTVTTHNVALEAFDNIVSTLNDLTPNDLDLEYNTAGAVVFDEVGICEQLGKHYARIESKPSFELGSVVEEISVSMHSPAAFDTRPHPGTTVAYFLRLAEAAGQGLVTLESKGVAAGDAVSITVDNTSGYRGDRVQVMMYLELYGPSASPQVAFDVETAIESTWGGHTTTDGTPVDVDVVTRVAPNTNNPPGTAGYHQIKLVPSGERSHVHNGELNDGIGSGTWETNHEHGTLVYSHEAGHLLGLPDRYHSFRREATGTWFRESDGEPFTADALAEYLVPLSPSGLSEEEILSRLNDGRTRVSVPHADHKDDLMGGLQGRALARQADIDFIAAHAGLSVDVRPGDVIVNKTSGDQNLVVTHAENVFAPDGESTTLGGLYASCMNALRDIPTQGGRFDVAPSLSDWGGIDGASLLQQLVEHVDESLGFCPSANLPVLRSVWRITDNVYRDDPDVVSYLESAGIQIGGARIRLPYLSTSTSAHTETRYVVPSQLAQLETTASTNDVLIPGQTVNLSSMVRSPSSAWTPASDFTWSLEPPAGTSISLTNAEGPETSFTATSGGIYRVRAEVDVIDAQGTMQTIEGAVRFTVADDHTETFESGSVLHRGTLEWLTGELRWTITDSVASTGDYSIASPAVDHGQFATFGARFDQITPGPLSFAFKISSQRHYDGLLLDVNGEVVDSWSGEADWDVTSVDLPAGSHTILWVYVKDGSLSAGEDRAWIDDVVLPKGAVVTALEAVVPGDKPDAYRLGQNYPNPVGGSTTIPFAIPEADYVTLKVFDIAGRHVATLVDGARAPGEYRVMSELDGVSGGVYFYELRSGSFVERRSMVVVR